MLTTVVMRSPVAPRHSPERSASVNSPIRRNTSWTSAPVSAPSTVTFRRRQPQRDVPHGAVLGRVDVSAVNIASRRCATPAARATSTRSRSVSRVIRCLL